jgi:signal transduction histidine kinase
LPDAARQASETLVRHIRQIDQYERDLPDLVQRLTSHAEDGGLAAAYQRYYDRQQERAVAYRSFLLLATLVLLGYTVQSFIRLREFNAGLERRVHERTFMLEQANKSLESFSYSVSHDLRAPLRAINGYSKILLDEERERLSAEGGRLLEQLARSADKLGDLINDILEYSRAERQVLQPTDVNMAALIAALVDQSRATYPKVRFEVAALPVVRGDQTMLRQVFQNLIDNACKFSARQEQPVVDISARREGDDAVFLVRDNGVGFDMRYADKLFGMFQRLHPTNEFAGTGVGLSIVKRLVDRQGGRIWAQAEPGRGALFSVSLKAA